MKVNFEYTKDEYKKYLMRSRLLNNVILFVIGTIVYLFLSYKNFSFIYFLLFLIGLIVFIYLLNKFYVFAYLKVNDMMNYNTYGKYIIELTPNKFSLTINKSKTNYKYNNVKKINVNKNYFEVKLKKSRDYLIFEKKLFKEEEYNKMIEMFKKYVN